VEEKEPSILSLDHFVSPNYCHWLFDSLFRVIALRKAYSAGARDALILIHATAPFITDSVALLGIPADRLRALGERARIRFKRLYVCSSSFWDLRHPAQLGSTEVLLAVRRHLAGRARPAPHRGAVFISRREASKRRLLNEDELEAALTPLGVTFIAAGGLSLSDQIEIFSGASLIIGAHGAGLANLLFAPPGATVLEIFPPSYGTASFFAASAGLGHRYVCVTGGDGVSRPPPSIRNNFFAREDFVAPVSAIAEFVAAQRLQS
jgi:capsular polysaccharide biosynthesis protein